WAGGTTSVIESVAYDNGQAIEPSFFTDGSLVQMTRFPVPEGDEVSLDRVLLAPAFENQFLFPEHPPTAPRDLELLVVEGTSGLPDLAKEVFSLTLDDPRPFTGFTGTFKYFSIDLSDNQAVLSNLPSEIYVGHSDVGADANYTALITAVNLVDNVSFYGNKNSNTWTSLWSHSQDGCCNQRVLPIRVDFLVTTILDVDEDTEPLVATLSQNYPNPF